MFVPGATIEREGHHPEEQETRLKSWITALGVFAITFATVPAVAADIELTFRFNYPEAEEMRAALDAFDQENPGVKVELQTIAWGESRPQFLREAAPGL